MMTPKKRALPEAFKANMIPKGGKKAAAKKPAAKPKPKAKAKPKRAAKRKPAARK
jgi:hypothetical protein